VGIWKAKISQKDDRSNVGIPSEQGKKM